MLSYSPSALNVLKKFHKTDVVVYVEGESDVFFWEHIFPQMNLGVSVKFKPAGDSAQAEAYARKIVSLMHR